MRYLENFRSGTSLRVPSAHGVSRARTGVRGRVGNQKPIKLRLSELLARYVLHLLDADDYERSPNDYETAKLRRGIERHLMRTQEPRRSSRPHDY